MPLPNTSPDMSPTPTTVNSSRLGVDAQLAEVPLHALPRAPGGDPHRLVVVAHRAAGGERVTEPEPVGRGDLVGDVGELGGALVGRDHEVGVVAVVAHDVRWRDGLGAPVGPGDEVVGDVEQPGDERPVAGHDLVADPARAARTTNPPFAPTGTITAFFTACALTRPRISVRKSCGPVGPAQTTPGDRRRSAGARPRPAGSTRRSRTGAAARACPAPRDGSILNDRNGRSR